MFTLPNSDGSVFCLKVRLFVHLSFRFRGMMALSLLVVIIFSFTLVGLTRLGVHATGMTFLTQAYWSTFGFKPRHDRVNPYEHVLTTSKVPGLVLDWKVPTANYMYSSPAVVGGVAISGGRGNLVGPFLGLLLLACIGPADSPSVIGQFGCSSSGR